MIGKGIGTPLAGILDNSVMVLFSPFLNKNSVAPGNDGNGAALMYQPEFGEFITPGGSKYFQLSNVGVADNGFITFDNVADSAIIFGLTNAQKGLVFPMTIEFTYKTNGTISTNQAFFGCNYGAGNDGWHVRAAASQFVIFYGDVSAGITYQNISGFVAFNVITSVMVVFKQDGTTAHYKNGVLQGNSVSGSAIPNFSGSSTENLGVGRVAPTTFPTSQFLIGDFRISNKERTLAEHTSFINNCYTSRLNNFSI